MQELKVANDHAERGVAFIQEYCELMTNDEQQQVALIQEYCELMTTDEQ